MKLDPDTAREILLHIEHEQNGPGWEWGIGNLQDYKRYYVASKLYEAGLIKANELPGDQPEEDYLVITELTFAGHQALESIRDPKAWAAAKVVATSVGSFAVDTLMAAGRAYVGGRLRELGIDVTY